jgi:hypothetical protein
MRLPSTVSGLRLRALRLLHSWLRLHSLWLLHPRLHMLGLHVCALLHTWLLCTLLSMHVLLLLCMLLHPLR